MNFDNEKFKKVVHYIIYKIGFKNTVGRTVIHKLLYFSDFKYYELYEKSITGESYKKGSRGPLPVHFESAVDELEEEGKVSRGKKKLPCGKTMKRYFSLKEPVIDLEKEELEVIDGVIRELRKMSGQVIANHSLSDEPVKLTEEDEIIEYELVFSRKGKNKDRVYVEID